MGSNSQKEDREKIMLETRETRLLLWDLLRLRYPRWKLIERLIPADEVLEELTRALNGRPKGRKAAFKRWQRLRLWPPPEILHSCEEQVLESHKLLG